MEVQDGQRMPSFRAAVLIATAMAAGLQECWVARQPVLLMGACRSGARAWLLLQVASDRRLRHIVHACCTLCSRC
jgi:hypothetical protein